MRFNLGEIFPQPELQWKDTQYRQKNTDRTSNTLHTYKCQSHDTNKQVLGEIALRSPSYVAWGPVAADPRYQELSEGFLPFRKPSECSDDADRRQLRSKGFPS